MFHSQDGIIAARLTNKTAASPFFQSQANCSCTWVATLHLSSTVWLFKIQYIYSHDHIPGKFMTRDHTLYKNSCHLA